MSAGTHMEYRLEMEGQRGAGRLREGESDIRLWLLGCFDSWLPSGAIN